jgi:acyl carrier protein
MASAEEVRNAIVEFLRELSPKARDQPLGDETNMVQSGLIDSFGLLELVSKLEARFGMSIDIGAVDFETFTTIGGLGDAVRAQLG